MVELKICYVSGRIYSKHLGNLHKHREIRTVNLLAFSYLSKQNVQTDAYLDI